MTTTLQWLEGFASQGLTDDQASRLRQERLTFKAECSGSTGDWVQFYTGENNSDRAIVASTSSIQLGDAGLGNALVFGVSCESMTSGSLFEVCISGYFPQANVATAVTASQPLVCDATSGGRAVAIAAADLAPSVGVALENAAGNECDVIVFRRI